MRLFDSSSRPVHPSSASSDSPPDELREFAQAVLAASSHQLVMVDFWAPWCGPCKQLTPLLARAVEAARPAVKLVKINIDDHPSIAHQFGIQSIPAVFAFFAGQPIDGFVGLLSESQITAFIQRASEKAGLTPEEATENTDTALLEAAQNALRKADIPTALDCYSRLLAINPQSAPAAAGIARCYLANGDHIQARGILASLEENNDPTIQSALAAIDLVERSQKLWRDPATLEQCLKTSPHDHTARLERALRRFAKNDYEGAIKDLLAIIRHDRTWNDEAGRRTLLDLLEALGPDHPATANARRQLSALLFS